MLRRMSDLRVHETASMDRNAMINSDEKGTVFKVTLDQIRKFPGAETFAGFLSACIFLPKPDKQAKRNT